MVVGRLLDERRPFRRRHLFARLCQPGYLLHAALRRGRHRVEKGEKTGQAVYGSPALLGTAFNPTLKPNRCEPPSLAREDGR
jgi:hypothetical protein